MKWDSETVARWAHCPAYMCRRRRVAPTCILFQARPVTLIEANRQLHIDAGTTGSELRQSRAGESSNGDRKESLLTLHPARSQPLQP